LFSKTHVTKHCKRAVAASNCKRPTLSSLAGFTLQPRTNFVCDRIGDQLKSQGAIAHRPNREPGIRISFAPETTSSIRNEHDRTQTKTPAPDREDTYNAYLNVVGAKPNGQIQFPYGCAAYDEINLLLLGIASAKSTEGRAIADHIMKVANGPGERATTFAEGAKLLAEGKPINYDGASSSADFLPNGMLKSRDFALYQIKGGEDVAILTTKSTAE